jgi:hypothetical protein
MCCHGVHHYWHCRDWVDVERPYPRRFESRRREDRVRPPEREEERDSTEQRLRRLEQELDELRASSAK